MYQDPKPIDNVVLLRAIDYEHLHIDIEDIVLTMRNDDHSTNQLTNPIYPRYILESSATLRCTVPI